MSPPLPRKAGNKDLPPHIEVDKKKNGTVYYRYVFPDGTRSSLGKDKKDAIDAAMALNVELSRNPDIFHKILNRYQENKAPKSPPIQFAIEQFKKLHLYKKTYSPRSLQEIEYRLSEYLRVFNNKNISDIAVTDIAIFLNSKTAHSYVKHRILLVQLWAFCCHQGWVDDNIPDKTMLAIVPAKKRGRHTLIALMKIRAICPDYMQRAIDIALHSIQRRGDEVNLHREHVNIEKNTLTVLQEKTKNYNKPVFIEIDMHPELRDAVDACLSTGIPCPYLLHYRPTKISAKIRAAKAHPFAMTPNFVTKEFTYWRDQAGVYDDMGDGEKPTWHDIRALGITLITERYGKEYAMALAGHADERMWSHYMSGHGEMKPVKVSFR